MIYWKLFYTFLKIGLFNFGGGYAMISFLQNEVVVKQGWLNTSQFTDIVAISQVTPGPVGINMATYTGYTASGSVWGAAIATTALCLPSFILIILLSHYLLKKQHSPSVEGVFSGLRPAVVGLIAAATLALCHSQNFIDYKSFLLFGGAFAAVWSKKIGPMGVLCISALLGLLFY